MGEAALGGATAAAEGEVVVKTGGSVEVEVEVGGEVIPEVGIEGEVMAGGEDGGGSASWHGGCES